MPKINLKNLTALKLLIPLFALGLFFAFPSFANAASRYWVGGGSSTNWNATSPTNRSATDGGANNAI
ncbi:MAG: hypothetical protein V1732_05425 [Patescibacteria group bacterium]